jgi:RNA polymerase sigma-70 factor, ECF subfamily
MDKDLQLFNEIKGGNKKVFEQLFKAYYAPLCLFSKQFLKDHDECEEVVQNLFLKIWEKRESIEIVTSVRSYLFGSVRNSCLNWLKHRKIQQEYQKVVERYEATEDTYGSYFLEVGLLEKIEKAISSLPERRREIFLLNREKGMKYREIAESLGLSVKTIETQMGQALKTLREALALYRNTIITFLFCWSDQGNRRMNCR